MQMLGTKFAAFFALVLLGGSPAPGKAKQFFSIGTRGTGATYGPLSGTIANAISKPTALGPATRAAVAASKG